MLNWFKRYIFFIDESVTTTKESDHNVGGEFKAKVEQETSLERLGDLSFKSGDLVVAAQYYQRALLAESSNAVLYSKLGDVFYEQYEYALAEVQYKHALVLQSDFPEAELSLGLCLDNTGRYQDALICYQHVVQMQPANHFAHYNIAVTHTSLGHIAEAMSAYRNAIDIKPDFNFAQFNLAVLLQRQGNLLDAETLYLQILSDNPNHFLAYCNLGILYMENHNYILAREKLLHSLSINSQHVETSYNLGKLELELGNANLASNYFNRTLVLKPDFAGAMIGLGDAYKAQHLLQEAESTYRLAIGLQREHPAAYCNLGVMLHDQQQYAKALTLYQQGVVNGAGSILLYNNLGNTLSSVNCLSEGEAAYRKALELGTEVLEADSELVGLSGPDQILTHTNLGLMHMQKKEFLLARENFLISLRNHPEHVETIYNLGLIELKLEKTEAALTYFKQALHLRSNFFEAMIGIGNVYTAQQLLSQATAIYRQVIATKANNPEAYCKLGAILYGQKKIMEAIAIYEEAIANDVSSMTLYSNLGKAYSSINCFADAEVCFSKLFQMEQDGYSGYIKLAPEYAQTYGNLLFALNYDPDRSAEDIFDSYQEYEKRYALRYKSAWLPFANDKNRQRRLKIGYISPDFCHHPVQYFLEPLMSQHDKDLVEVYAYAQLSTEDHVTKRYKQYADHWVPTGGYSDDALAQRIRDDGIDVLIDLAGHTANNRLSVLARRPAPVQVSWLGFAYTTGLTAIDYYLTDHMSAPPGSEHLFAEQVWRLNTPFIVYRPAAGMGEVSPLPALTGKKIRIGTLTRSIRINHKTIRTWAAILKRIDNAVLVVDSANYQDLQLRQALIDKFAAHGVDASQLDIGFHTPPWNTLRSLDIGLDCFPHNSGTTLFETLYMGVPFVTLAGRPSVGRLGGSILIGAGHPEWIANTEEEYVEKVVALAQDIPKLAETRSVLREEMQNSALMDEAGFTREVESAYRSMWAKWCETPA
ncbi:tetratricopeptide repeat protein [Undibacterium sp. JH2W]|uniref:tetratricopeptide repeat protein n=1 Tax=Undibacterium sp. JH2W TaxID=3413037 RepID=UPI003BF3CE2A